MQARAQPNVDLPAAHGSRQLRLLDQRAPGRVAGDAGRLRGRRGVELAPHQAPEAVGADDRLAFPGARVVARHADEVVAGLHLRDARGGDERTGAARAHGFEQQAVQVGTVHAEIGGAVALLHGVAERHAGQLGAAVGAVHHQRIGPRRDGREALSQIKLLEAPRGVGAELHAGADFAEDGGLLENVGPVPVPGKRQRGGQPPDAAPGDEDVRGHRLSGCAWTTARWTWGSRPCRLRWV